MSAKIIIYITGKPTLHGLKRREFQWSAAHGLYLYENRELELAEFNAKYEKAARTNSDLNVRVKVMGGDSVAAPSAVIATIATAHEITAEEAEAVLQRLAPDRLKKAPGRKARVLEVA